MQLSLGCIGICAVVVTVDLLDVLRYQPRMHADHLRYRLWNYSAIIVKACHFTHEKYISRQRFAQIVHVVNVGAIIYVVIPTATPATPDQMRFEHNIEQLRLGTRLPDEYWIKL